MRTLLVIISLLVVAAVGIYGAGSVLPAEHTIIRGAHISEPVDSVWQVISDFESMADWNPEIVSVKAVSKEGEASASPSRWRIEYRDDNYMLVEVEKTQPPQLHVSKIVDSSYPFSGKWIIELSPQSGGTWIKLTEKGYIPSPFVRFMVYYMTGADREIMIFFNNLGRKFNQPVKVEELVA